MAFNEHPDLHPPSLLQPPPRPAAESPERLQAVQQALKTPEFAAAVSRDAPLGTFDQVLHIQTPDYVETVQALSPVNGYRAPVRALMG